MLWAKAASTGVVIGLLSLLCPLLPSWGQTTRPHCDQKSMSTHRVIVHISIKDTRSVLSNALTNELLAARMFPDEVCDVVKHASDGNKVSPTFDLLYVLIPRVDREVLSWHFVDLAPSSLHFFTSSTRFRGTHERVSRARGSYSSCRSGS